MKRLLIIFSMFMVFFSGYAKEININPEVGAKIPNLKLENLDERKVNSRRIFNNGKETLIVMAAEWCPHCHQELPEIQKFYEENKDKINVIVIFTNRKTSLENTKQYVKDSKFTFPAFFDSDDSIFKSFKIKNVPTNFKVKNSEIEEIVQDIMKYDDLSEMFER